MDATSSTIHPISGEPLKPAEHRRVMGALLAILIVIAAALGVWYWMSVGQTPVSTAPVVTNQEKLRAEVAALLTSAPSHASQTDINNVASLLTNSKSTATESTREAVAKQLAK